MFTRILLAVVVLTVLLGISGCSNSKTVEPIPDSDTAVVSGKVMASWCVPWIDPPTPPEWLFPYTEETGYQATVEFFSSTGKQWSTVTDGHSQYSAELDTGNYTVVVSSWHSWPYRFINVHIGRDTTFEPTIFLQYQWPDTVLCRFYYQNAADTLTETAERAQLDKLNAWAGAHGAYNSMAVESAVRKVSEFTEPFYKMVDYYVNPRPSWYVWQIVDAGTATLATNESQFWSGLSVEASYIICFDFGKEATHDTVTIDCGR